MIKDKGKKGTNKEYETETEEEEKAQSRGKPKIISNIQIAPPKSSLRDGRDDEGWNVVKRTRKKDKGTKGNKVKDKEDLLTKNKGYLQKNNTRFLRHRLTQSLIKRRLKLILV